MRGSHESEWAQLSLVVDRVTQRQERKKAGEELVIVFHSGDKFLRDYLKGVVAHGSRSWSPSPPAQACGKRNTMMEEHEGTHHSPHHGQEGASVGQDGGVGT